MSIATSHESRQTRRWRERQETKRPASPPRKPFVLLCRVEDAHGQGAWLLTEAEPEEGAALARDLHAAADDVLGELQPPRCELVPNTPAGLRAWAAASLKRRDVARRLGAVLR